MVRRCINSDACYALSQVGSLNINSRMLHSMLIALHTRHLLELNLNILEKHGIQFPRDIFALENIQR